MRAHLLALGLVPLLACTQEKPGDTADTSGGGDTADTAADTSITNDTGGVVIDTSDTSDSGTTDTGDTADTGGGGGGGDTSDTDTGGGGGGDTGGSGGAGPTLRMIADDTPIVSTSRDTISLEATGDARLTGRAGAWSALRGTATVYSASLTSGAAICDFEVGLTGTAAASPCPNCEFDFDITGALGRDASTASCDYAPELSLLEIGAWTDRSLRYIPSYEVPEYSYESTCYDPRSGRYRPCTITVPAYTVEEKLQTGGTYTFSGYYGYYGYTGGYGWSYERFTTIAPLPSADSYYGYGYPVPMRSGASSGGRSTTTPPGYGYGGYGYGGYGGYGYYGSTATGTMAFDDSVGTLSWLYTSEETTSVTTYAHVNEECGYDLSTETSLVTGGSTVTGSVPCDAMSADVWGATVSVGETLDISVDTTSRRSAFAPYLWINTPDTCTVVVGYDNTACTVGGTGCPTLTWTSTVDGEVEVVVGALDPSTCAGSVGAYRVNAVSR